MRHAYLLLFPLSLILPQTVLAQQGTLVGETLGRTIKASATRFDAKAARDNLDPAYCYRTAIKLENGDGAEQDLPGALAWYRKAAGLGHAEAMAALGQLYHSGHGVERDEAQAVHWYRQAAGAGSVIAAYNLAVILATSETTPRDPEQARRLYEQAAAGGFAKAQFNLAQLLADPAFGQPDVEQAYKWMVLARDGGIGRADSQLAALAVRMTPDQVARGGELARQWHPTTAH
ncbi:tetratricopeptide repeat protein [Massilia sp. Mn16-1_5]|uniref:tetratricopeptide repeat protein n=1 Tax=Massilia sp. Mn16-1_5 TaxID=2079199 RepID=UPI00109EC284|nr:tetratricopeptide repeat protein [Massilia sp. Mn16-1_5]THC40761.1 hypothetical protein C2862_20575 [Massilia sp. Mn16-1_5]